MGTSGSFSGKKILLNFHSGWRRGRRGQAAVPGGGRAEDAGAALPGRGGAADRLRLPDRGGVRVAARLQDPQQLAPEGRGGGRRRLAEPAGARAVPAGDPHAGGEVGRDQDINGGQAARRRPASKKNSSFPLSN